MACFDPDRFRGLQGSFHDFPYDDPDSNVPSRGDELSLRYGLLGPSRPRFDPADPWFDAEGTSGSDYGGGLVSKSNYEALLDKAVELDLNPNIVPDDCRPFFVTLYGGYNTYAIVFHAERTPDEIVEMLEGLANYPLIDEDRHSRMEHEAEEEAWSNWVEREYRRALEAEAEKRFAAEVDLDEVSDDDLYEHFRENMDGANEYWTHESDGPYVRVERVAEYALSGDDPLEDQLPPGAAVKRAQYADPDAWLDARVRDTDFDGVRAPRRPLMDFPSFHKRRR